MNLFNDDERAEIESMIDDVHDTFYKIIKIRKQSELIVAAFDDTSYNSIYGYNSQGQKKKITREEVVEGRARIIHKDERLDLFNDPSIQDQLRVRIPSNTVRIRVDEATYEILKEAKRVEIVAENAVYKVASDFRPHGVFKNRYYDAFLHPLDEED